MIVRSKTMDDKLIFAQDEWKRLPDNSPIPKTSKHENKTIIADLQDFEIYRCPTNDRTRPYELTSLHLFDVKAKNLCFDGYVRLGKVKHYLERISIEDLSIEGYGRTKSSRIDAYIQTKLASNDRTHNIWFRLRKPAPRYERFHNPFLWVATLGKHVIDYMDSQPKASVGLESFHTDFHSWLVQRFGLNKRFKIWFRAFHNTSDFRVAVSAYIDYIINQAYNLSTSTYLTSHPLWAQCKCDRRLAVRIQPKLVKETVTTPHVLECFKDMYFASKLKRVDLSRDVKKAQEKRMRSLGFAKSVSMYHSITKHADNKTRNISVHMGDVVSIIPDEVDKRKWQKSGEEWLAYVQGIELCGDGQQQLMVLWFYRPVDTNICLARYPVAKEVFLSDNCNCGERKIFSTDVSRKYSVDWSPRILDTAKDLIIRQTYITQDSAFLTVNDDHKLCSCRKPKVTSSGWRAGDTVYISKTVNGTQLLEPVVIHDINYKSKEVIVRTLLRLDRDCTQLATKAGRSKVAPNELVLTGRLKALPISRIKRPCHVRFVPQHDLLEDRMPSWYKARGSGDFWYISMGLESVNDAQRLFFLDRLPHGFHEAQEVPLPRTRLKGLSLFSGGGSLDRGLEEGGAVEFQTAVDYDPAAIHTQRANCRDPARMRLFCGSVDDYLQSLLFGNLINSVALINEVELISAGSPCPGTLRVVFFYGTQN
jgi:DNA (cytosine-5)-methyltransferase 1